jgi:hypothetical protein
MSVPEPVAARVRRRAQGRCEYCRMSQSLQGATFHVEHIVPRSRGGTTTDENLALACPGCNLRKADRIAAVDPLTDSEVPLFHPRRDRWADHFEWDGIRLVGTSSVGRATLVALELNHARRTRIREAEAQFGLFPPR